MKQTITILLLSISSYLFSSYLFGTPQLSDILIYKNVRYSLNSDDYRLIYPLEKIYTDSAIAKIFFNQSIPELSICWRGYIAEWTIEDNKLYLTKLETCGNDRGEITANLLKGFANKCKKNKVLADWVSGMIYGSIGKLLYYGNEGEVYENNILFVIENGVCKEIKQCKNSKYESTYFKINKDLVKFIRSKINVNKLPITDSNKEIKVIIQITSGKTNTDFKVKVFKGYNKYYDDLALSILRQLPEWNVYYKHCQITNISHLIPIKFNNRLNKD